MKLHDSQMAPNPRRVRFFLAEKGVEVPTVQVNIGTGEHQTDEFKKLNPLARVPVLELDDGTGLAESVAICRYFEETHPDPPLMGVDAEDKALVEMWNRRMELEVLSNVAGCFRNTHDFFKGRIPQVAEYGELCRKAAHQRVAWLDEVLADSAFIAGDRFTIADITAVVGIDFGRLIDLRVLPEQKNLTRWHEAVSARPAASA